MTPENKTRLITAVIMAIAILLLCVIWYGENTEQYLYTEDVLPSGGLITTDKSQWVKTNTIPYSDTLHSEITAKTLRR